MRVGFAASKQDVAIEGYMRALSYPSCITSGCTRRQLHTWLYGHDWKPLDVVVVTAQWFMPLFETMEWRGVGRPFFIGLELDEELDGKFDARYTAYDLDWGVDKPKWQVIGRNRVHERLPVFYFTEPHPLMEEVRSLGYKATAGNGQYYLGNVAVVPGKRVVPYDIYEAAAAEMPVVSLEENRCWLERVAGYEVVLEDGIQAVVETVAASDFTFMGMMAQERVPYWKDFRTRVRGLLTNVAK